MLPAVYNLNSDIILGVPPNRHTPLGVGCSAISHAARANGIIKLRQTLAQHGLAASPPHAFGTPMACPWI
jgi:hypothetical protein